jgi:hypothetical protein
VRKNEKRKQANKCVKQTGRKVAAHSHSGRKEKKLNKWRRRKRKAQGPSLGDKSKKKNLQVLDTLAGECDRTLYYPLQV